MVKANWRGMVVANVNGSLWQSGVHSRLQQLAVSAAKKDAEEKEMRVVTRGADGEERVMMDLRVRGVTHTNVCWVN